MAKTKKKEKRKKKSTKKNEEGFLPCAADSSDPVQQRCQRQQQQKLCHRGLPHRQQGFGIRVLLWIPCGQNALRCEPICEWQNRQ